MTCISWAIIMTVLPILRLKRLVALPHWFTVLLYADMYLFALSLCHGMYLAPDTVGWWGEFTHVISGIVVASIVFMALCQMEAHAPPHVTLGGRGGIAVLVFVISCAFGAIWETIEGLTDTISKFNYMVYGAVDTVYDLLCDIAGSFIMAVIAYYILSKHSAKHVASQVRLGKKNIDVPE